jgi:DNA-binding CsgD family transcriptional regulator
MDMPPIRYTHAEDGTRIAYTVIPGDSPPWLHLYSLGAPTIELDFSVAARFGYIQNLAHGRATVLFDHRGSGFSGPFKDELTVDDLVDDVAAVTQAIDEPVDVSVMGTGCLVAFRYAAAHGANGWRSLVLLGAIEIRFAGSYQDVGQAMWHKGSYRTWLASAGRNSMDVSPAEVLPLAQRWSELVPEATQAAYVRSVANLDFTCDAGQLRIPTLVVSHPRYKGAIETAGTIPGAAFAAVDLLVNRPELGTEVRAHWERHIRPQLGVQRSASPTGTNSYHLTDRECDVLSLLASGHSNAGIAAALVMSVRTVERHVQNIYSKLGVHNRVEAANWAMRNGVG